MHIRNYFALLCGMAISTATPAYAQVPPSGNDLKAEYCLGLALDQQQWDAQFCSGMQNPSAKQVDDCKKGTALVDSRVNSLQKYLIGKKLLDNGDLPNMLAAKYPSLQQGEVDVHECRETVFSAKFQSCAKQCTDNNKDDSQQISACVQKQCETDVCRKTERCHDLDFLPLELQPQEPQPQKSK